ncbi:acyltransferase family protein [Butyrivibrio sp. FCS006]|uniref:acyltransferase family protein n=1 Tax=Butyrivibrio sp. FCS006 TaxID=1280684 RepID=UPI00041E68BC|nr:acyltransferase family protein [Butyrivibrio sp. FCS006]
MTGQTKRVEWVDTLKYICIMWVMLSHLESKTGFLKTFYNPFFLNGFFFSSGYVYFHKDEFKQFFAKKIRGLFVPWLIFSVFNILLSQLISFNNHSSLLDELKWNFFQIRGKGDGIWFVAALFVAFIPFYFFIDKYEKSQKKLKDNILFIIVTLSLALISSLYGKYMNPNLLPWGTYNLPWHIEYIFIAMFWMFMGYMFRNEYEKMYDKNVNAISAIIVFLFYIILQYAPYLTGSYILNGFISIIYSYIVSFLGVFVLIYLCKKITPNKYMLYIGQNTLICFALHGKIYSILQTILKKTVGLLYAAILANTFASSIFAIVFTIILSLILIFPIFIINRWFPFLIGRKRS